MSETARRRSRRKRRRSREWGRNVPARSVGDDDVGDGSGAGEGGWDAGDDERRGIAGKKITKREAQEEEEETRGGKS